MHGIPCRSCAFLVQEEDRFCSGCGQPQLLVELEHEGQLVAFLPPRGTGAAAFQLVNRGARDVRVELAATGVGGAFSGVSTSGRTVEAGAIGLSAGDRADVEFHCEEEGGAPGDGRIVARYGGLEATARLQVLLPPGLRLLHDGEPATREFTPDLADGSAEAWHIFSVPGEPTDDVIDVRLTLEIEGFSDARLVDLGDQDNRCKLARRPPTKGRLSDLVLHVRQRYRPGDPDPPPLRVTVYVAGLLPFNVEALWDLTERPLLTFGKKKWFQGPLVSGLGRKEVRPIRIRNGGHKPVRLERVRFAEPWVQARGFAPVELEPGAGFDASYEGGTVCELPVAIDADALSAAHAGEAAAGPIEGQCHLEVQVAFGDGFTETWRKIEQLAVACQRAPMLDEFAVGIDFGTTNTCIAYYGKRHHRDPHPGAGGTRAVGDGGSIRMFDLDVEDTAHLFEFPTVFEFKDFDRLEGLSLRTPKEEVDRIATYGQIPKATMLLNGHNYGRTAWAFKPDLGRADAPRQHLDASGDVYRRFSPRELTEVYLTEVFRRLIQAIGHRVGSVVATFPGGFPKEGREDLVAAMRDALGLGEGDEEPVLLVPEPVALAVDHIRQRTGAIQKRPTEEPYRFAVFDFGGGTTDIAVCEVQVEGMLRTLHPRVVKTGGVAVGGELLTFELARHLFERFLGQKAPLKDVPDDERPRAVELMKELRFPAELGELHAPFQEFEEHDRANVLAFLSAAELLKTGRLEPGAAWDLTLRLPGRPELLTEAPGLTAKEAERAVAPLVQRAIDHFEDTVLRGARFSRLDAVLLAGNSCRSPWIRDRMEAHCKGLQLVADVEDDKHFVWLPDTCKIGVVMGALEYVHGDRQIDILEEEEERGGLSADLLAEDVRPADDLRWEGQRFPIFEQGMDLGADWTPAAGNRFVTRFMRFKPKLLVYQGAGANQRQAGHWNVGRLDRGFLKGEVYVSFFVRQGEDDKEELKAVFAHAGVPELVREAVWTRDV